MLAAAVSLCAISGRLHTKLMVLLHTQGARQPTSYYTAPAGPAPPAAAPAYVPPASAPSGSYAMSYSSPATRAAPQQSPADALASVKVSQCMQSGLWVYSNLRKG